MLSAPRSGAFVLALTSLASPTLLGACSSAEVRREATDSTAQAIGTQGYDALNLAAGSMVLYEAQIRSANACDPAVGSAAQRAACAAKVAPTQVYRAQGTTCPTLGALEQIRLGTIDDMLAPTADASTGITLRYIHDKVGATTVWLMPLFPNNDTWNIPDPCDNLGSPYAVRDYFHASGALSRACIAAGNDEHSATRCWANTDLDTLIADAHALGLKVMLDVALNHFGHNYEMYDVAGIRTVRDRAAAGEDLSQLWNFAATYDPALVAPALVDTPASLASLAASDASVASTLAQLDAHCPGLPATTRVTAYHAFHDGFDWDRAAFPCDPGASYLENQLPGYYLGANAYDPSTHLGDDYASQWPDVKFLFHHEENTAHSWEFIREREYLFRVLNYWLSRGVDGFRLDHTTDPESGMGSNEWKYLATKLDYYASRRGQAQPVYLAEEFAEQAEMNKVTDIMTEGYVGDMCGRDGETKDASYVEGVTENTNRFGGHAFVMTALETHDERRLVDGTGFDVWTGAGFWGIGATLRSTPMILMGQEIGEPWQLSFRRADYLRSRFAGSGNDSPAASALGGYYQSMIHARLAEENRALLAPNHAYLRTQSTGEADPRIFAQVKWSDDGNVVFVFHNLWEQNVSQSYFLDPSVVASIHLLPASQYRLVDALSGAAFECQTGAALAWSLYVAMDAGTRAQWLRLELCQ